MQKTLEAVYTGGVLRPLESLDQLQENQRVVVTVTTATEKNPFVGWVGGLTDEDAARMIEVIDAEFESVDPNEWK